MNEPMKEQIREMEGEVMNVLMNYKRQWWMPLVVYIRKGSRPTTT